MNWNQLIQAVAADSGVNHAQAKRVLGALSAVTLRSLAAGEEVLLKDIGTVGLKLRRSTAVRSIANRRKMLVGERYLVQMRPAAAAKRVAAARLPAHWKKPEHQAAWRLAQALVGDLGLYHGSKAPSLEANASDEAVRLTCATAFGSAWRQATQTYSKDVPKAVTADRDYLASVARQTWS